MADECSRLLADHASAISMAFTANLAVALWAMLRQRFQGQRVELTEAADALARSEFIQEELSIRRLRRTIKGWLGTADFLWWLGLGTGLSAALFLYVLRWHGHDGWWAVRLCRMEPLMMAAYTSPAVMTVMTFVGLEGNRRSTKQLAALQDLERQRDVAYDPVEESARTLRRLLRDAPGKGQ